jgi:hypothetical protein
MGIADKFDALVPTSMDQLIMLAERVSKSTMIPRDYQGKPADCLVAMSLGLEVGLKPMQALQSICVINNRPGLWGTAARALVMATGQLQSLFETEPAEVDKTGKARCEIVRKGYAEVFVGEFSLENARKAGLTGKDNYQKYPGPMLTWRAFHGAARKAFPDVYKGLAAAEEMQDTTPFNRAASEDAPPITLSLDAPTISADGESDVQGGARSPDASPSQSAKAKRGRPRNQEPQAPSKAVAEVTPLSPAAAAASSSQAQPELCGFCHKPGHGFNECPEQNAPEGGDADAPERNASADKTVAAPAPAGAAANGRSVNNEEQAELIRMAVLLRPLGGAMRWLREQLGSLGVEEIDELPADKMDALIKSMQTNA